MVDVGCGPDRKIPARAHSTPKKRRISDSFDDDTPDDLDNDYDPVNDPDLSEIRYIVIFTSFLLLSDNFCFL